VPKPDNIATEVWLLELREERRNLRQIAANQKESREDQFISLSCGFQGRYQVDAGAIEEEMLSQKITVL
jgi:hypothetical protein